MELSLSKKIYNNKETVDYLNSDFTDIIKSKPRVSVKSFFSAYKDLFYKVPKKGEKSHTALLTQSQEFLDDYKDPFSDRILELNDEIERLDNILNNKQSVIKEEDPFYPDDSLLKFENNANSLPIWIMQQGAKRKITNGDTLSSIKKTLGYEYDTPTGEIVQKLDLNTLENIVKGPDINSDEDLNLFNFATSVDSMELLDHIDHTTSFVTCIEGKQDDIYDWYKPINSDGWQINGLGPNEGKNHPRKDYLGPNNGLGCRIEKYSIGLNEAGEVYQSSRRIYPGETIKIWYRNSPIVNGQTINNNNSLHNVTGFIKEVRKTSSTRELTFDEYNTDEFGRIFSNLTPHGDHLDDVNGGTRVRFYDVPQRFDTY